MLYRRELGVAHRLMVVYKPPIRQSPRLSAKSDRSTGSDMRSGSLPKSKLKALSFAEAVMSPTPEEKKARERVDAKKRRNKKPEEGKEEKKKEAFKFAIPLTILDDS